MLEFAGFNVGGCRTLLAQISEFVAHHRLAAGQMGHKPVPLLVFTIESRGGITPRQPSR
jgi:hypothetical protein